MTLPDGAADKLVLLLVSGITTADIRTTATEALKIEPAHVDKAIAEARRRITLAARTDRNRETGAAITRYRDLYRRALAVQDTKTALAAQKELSKLLDLYRRDQAQPAETGHAEPTAADREAAAARAHLAGLDLGREGETLPELARLAALEIVNLRGRLEEPANHAK